MPLLETRGAASARGLGLLSSAATPVYIEDVFSTFLYTGNGSTQTINNGVDLLNRGGLVWLGQRNPLSSSYSHQLYDTDRGASNSLASFNTAQQFNRPNQVSAFTTSGFSLGDGNGSGLFANYPTSPNNDYFSWTFAKQPKFFDVVTYTGNGSSNRQIAHNLGSVPGCIIVKRTDGAASWAVWHNGIGSNQYLYLDSTIAATTDNSVFGGSPTATTFTVAGGGANVATNQNSATYVAYILAHNAGGFGLSGTDNVITCGSYGGNGVAGLAVTLGYEPQWLLVKTASTTSNWRVFDNMRGWPAPSGQDAFALFPNLANAETANGDLVYPSSTGFTLSANGTCNTNGETYIYIAIRRGPMRVPTDGTKVFGLSANSNNIDASTSVVMSPEASDLWLNSRRDGSAFFWLPRITGWRYLQSNSTAVEGTSYTWTQRTQTDLRPNTAWWTGNPSQINYFLRRAPGFFDEVCYTGDGTTNRLLSHNLAVQPEMIIYKSRSSASYDWIVNYLPYPNSVRLNKTDAAANYANGAAPTATQFYASGTSQNNNTDTYVAYLFATCPGVSKVGSYTGTGAVLQINCGFTGGARFILIKRTDSTGDWYVWDTARGIVAGNDPYLLLNSTAAEVTTTDWVDTLSTGFELSNAGGNNVNINGASYIFLAIA